MARVGPNLQLTNQGNLWAEASLKPTFSLTPSMTPSPLPQLVPSHLSITTGAYPFDQDPIGALVWLFIYFNIGSNLSKTLPFRTFSEDQLKFLLSQVVCNKRKEAELQVAKWMFDSLSLEQAFDLACHNNNVQVNHFEQKLVFCWVVTRSQILLTFTNISDIYIFF